MPADSPRPAEASVLRTLLRGLEVDRAVALAVALRGWQLVGGFVSTLLIALLFSKDQQGYYYTFLNLLAMQIFFELSLSIVVTNVASHEWSRLRLHPAGHIEGAPEALSRLVSLGRKLFLWYGLAALLFILVVGPVGMVFYGQPVVADAAPAEGAPAQAAQTAANGASSAPQAGKQAGAEPEQVQWLGPWWTVVVLTGLLLWALPFNALLEGCNQVATVNQFRLGQAISANLAVWVVIFLGGGLWAIAAAALMRLVWELLLLGVRYRRFFHAFLQPPASKGVDWWEELWPMQWRLAVSGIFNYFALNMFSLVLFQYHGPAAAGRMGMTWTLVSVMQAAALAWVQTRVPRMGMLIAEQRYGDLDRLFNRLLAISLAVVAGGGLAIWTGVFGLNLWLPKLAARLLSPTETGLLVLAILCYQAPNCQAMYIRAHKRDTLLGVSVVSATLIGLLVWQLGARFGALGAISGYLAVAALIVLPVQTRLWQQCRRTHPRS